MPAAAPQPSQMPAQMHSATAAAALAMALAAWPCLTQMLTATRCSCRPCCCIGRCLRGVPPESLWHLLGETTVVLWGLGVLHCQAPPVCNAFYWWRECSWGELFCSALPAGACRLCWAMQGFTQTLPVCGLQLRRCTRRVPAALLRTPGCCVQAAKTAVAWLAMVHGHSLLRCCTCVCTPCRLPRLQGACAVAP